MLLTRIDHLHARTKEFINTLIVVTSRLDAVITSMNVLNPMENGVHYFTERTGPDEIHTLFSEMDQTN